MEIKFNHINLKMFIDASHVHGQYDLKLTVFWLLSNILFLERFF